MLSVEELVREIEQYQGLRALRLEGNTVGVDAAQAIAKALESKDLLQVLLTLTRPHIYDTFNFLLPVVEAKTHSMLFSFCLKLFVSFRDAIGVTCSLDGCALRSQQPW